MTFFRRRRITVDPTWMTIIIAPGTGVNNFVAILLPQVALPSPALDQVRSGDVIRLLTGLADEPMIGNSNRCAADESECQKNEHVERGVHDVMIYTRDLIALGFLLTDDDA